MQAVVQLRGEVNISEDVVDTLAMLNLGRVNHCTFLPETDAYRGMITKVHDYVAHGEPSADTVATLLRRRADPESGEGDVDDEWVADTTDYDDVDALAEALLAEETTLSDVGLEPVLRLHPPRGGHDGVKQPVATGGQIGNHTTEEIDTLLTAMR
jgi:large subunit ribosomal protein L30